MKKVLNDHRVILVGGAGGVGKTTLAAALGIQSALAGHSTVVLTVDPAKRLAQALGFSDFKNDLQRIEVPGAKGELFASMLETQRYFDNIILRYAKSDTQKEKVLNHPIYRTMVDTLGGTQEYAAMERLLEFSEMDRFEKIIVDTPPSQNASDLLSAPQRLADFMDNSVLNWFSSTTGRAGKFFKRGTQAAMGVLQKILGGDFLGSFSTLIDQFDGLQEGFRQRHLQVLDLIKSPQTAFVLVTRPTRARLDEARSLITTLEKERISLRAMIANRVESAPPSLDSLSAELKQQLTPYSDYDRALFEHQKNILTELAPLAPNGLIEVPRQEGTLHEVTPLISLGENLIT